MASIQILILDRDVGRTLAGTNAMKRGTELTVVGPGAPMSELLSIQISPACFSGICAAIKRNPTGVERWPIFGAVSSRTPTNYLQICERGTPASLGPDCDHLPFVQSELLFNRSVLAPILSRACNSQRACHPFDAGIANPVPWD